MAKKLKTHVKGWYEFWRRERLKKRVINMKLDISTLRTDVLDMRKKNFSLSESSAYNLRENDFREYINTWEAYQPRLVKNPYFVVADDKYLFSLAMRNFVEVPEVFAIITNGTVSSVSREYLTNDNLFDYFLSQGGGVIKDRYGSDGYDVFVFKRNENKMDLYYKDGEITKISFDILVREIKSGLVQPIVEQSRFYNSIFSESINTVRLITMKTGEDSSKQEIVAAVQRIGTKRSAPVDNFNQGGGSALVDLNTGKLGKFTMVDSFSEEGTRLFFSRHPETDAPIEGQMVPNWSLIKRQIPDIARRLPFWNFIAWDVVVNDIGIMILEINLKSSLNVFQVHGGMRNTSFGERFREQGYLVDDVLFD